MTWLDAFFGRFNDDDAFADARKRLAELRESEQRLRDSLDTPEGRAWLDGSRDPYRGVRIELKVKARS